ncbi:unnamed protein product [Parajaminaea phylloscopi]
MSLGHCVRSPEQDEVDRMQAMSGPSYLPSSYIFPSPSRGDNDANDPLPDTSAFWGESSATLQHIREIVSRCAQMAPSEEYSGRRMGCHGPGSCELSWRDRSLVWSRDCQVVRSFEFKERIVDAVWTFMSSTSPLPKPSRRTRGDMGHTRWTGKRPVISSKADPESAFSLQQQALHRMLAGNPSDDPSRAQHHGDAGIRTLTVVLESSIWLYHPLTGEEFSIAKSFRLAQAFAATTGVFFQRRLEAEDTRLPAIHGQQRSSASFTPQLPTFFFLGHHLGDITPAAVRSADGVSFFDADETSIYVSGELDSSPSASAGVPVVVSVNPKAGTVKIYAYAVGTDVTPTADSSCKVATSEHEGPSDQSHSAVAKPPIGKGRPSLEPLRRSSRLSNQTQGNAMGSFSGQREASTSALSARKASRRRSSRFPSVADAGNMSRIDESMTQYRDKAPSLGNGVGSSSLAVTTELALHYGDAEEAEEMGQLVDNLSRSRGVARQSKKNGADSNVADDTMASRVISARTSSGHASLSRQRRISNMIATPFAPPGRYGSRSAAKARLSRGAEGEAEALSFHSTNLAGVSMLTAFSAADEKQWDMDDRNVATASAVQSMASSFSEPPAAELVLIESIQVVPFPDCALASAFALSTETESIEDGSHRRTHVFVQVPGQLLARTITKSNRGQSVTISARQNMPSLSAVSVNASSRKSPAVLVLDPDGLAAKLFEFPDLSSSFLALALIREQDRFSFVPRDECREPEQQIAMSGLEASVGLHDSVLVKRANGDSETAALPAMSAEDVLVERFLAACDRSNGIRIQYARHRRSVGSDWNALEKTLLLASDASCHGAQLEASAASLDPFGLLPSSQEGSSLSPPMPPSVHPGVQPIISQILAILHAMGQDLTLDIVEEAANLDRLSQLIVRLSYAAGAREICNYWCSAKPKTAALALEHAGAIAVTDRLNVKAPDHLNVLSLATCCQAEAVTVLQNLSPLLTSAQLRTASPLTCRVLKVLCSRPRSAAKCEKGRSDGEGSRDAAMVEALVHQRFSLASIDRLPWTIALKFRDALRACAAVAPERMSSEAYRLMGRQDLAARDEAGRTARFPWETLRSLPTSVPLSGLSAMLFSQDYRLQDVVDMLQTHKVTVLKAPSVAHRSEEEARDAGLALLHNVAERTKASPVGRGMLLLLTRSFDPTQRWTIPRLNRRILLRPAQPYNHPEPRPESAELEWPEFHNGVASGLEMVVDSVQVDSIWYFSQSSGERNAGHAGLLLGLGLAGRFATIGQVHTYRYLGDRHDLTSIGLLLGLSATFVGRGDPDVRALLACHVKAFLPPHSANLAHSTLVQSAALLGTGLLFLGTGVQHIAESLCDQIGAQELETTDAQMFSRGAYSLSAAIGTGLVMLGRARRVPMSTVREKRLLAKLEHYMAGPAASLLEDTPGDLVWKVDRRITAPVAALAYALIFLKSNDRKAAARLVFPNTRMALDQVRPDTLLLYSIGRNLILWDEMEPETTWPVSTLPGFLRDKRRDPHRPLPINLRLARLHILCGAFFAMALKYAGSNSPSAKKVLLEYHATIEHEHKQAEKQTFEGRVFCTALRSSADLMAISLSIVLAGSGDVDVLKLLRLAHAQSPAKGPYGSHMAIHMALGMLFLAGGRCTLGTSDAAVASLLVAFYPRFPTKATDNRAHLQAYRHLWLLGVEPRLVIAQDVKSGEMVYVPVTVQHEDGQGAEKHDTSAVTPLQLPSLDRVRAVKVSSPRYHEITSRFDDVRSARTRMSVHGNARTVFVQRKTGYTSYAADPKGFKSDLIRASAADRRLVGAETAQHLSSCGYTAGVRPARPELDRLLSYLLRGDARADWMDGGNEEDGLLAAAFSECCDGDELDLLALCVSLLRSRDLSVEPLRVRDLMAVVGDRKGKAAQPQALLTSTRDALECLARAQLCEVDVRRAIDAYLCDDAILVAACRGQPGLMTRVSNTIAILAARVGITDLCRLGVLMRGLLDEGDGLAGLSAQEAALAVEGVLDVGCEAVRQMGAGRAVHRDLLRVLLRRDASAAA